MQLRDQPVAVIDLARGPVFEDYSCGWSGASNGLPGPRHALVGQFGGAADATGGIRGSDPVKAIQVEVVPVARW